MSRRSRPTSSCDRPAGCEVQPLDFDQGGIGIGDIPADDRVPWGLQCAGQIEPHRVGDLDEILALRHALHAVDAKPGQVVSVFGDQRIAVRGLQVAIGGERLLEGQGQAREQAGEGSEHDQAPGRSGNSRRCSGDAATPLQPSTIAG